MYTSTTDIHSHSLHDALPIWLYPFERLRIAANKERKFARRRLRLATRDRRIQESATFFSELLAKLLNQGRGNGTRLDRKSTRLNSSHVKISYAVFCLKKINEE